MTRLASIAKAGFYPTPDRVTEWIAHAARPLSTDGGRLLDPCCGEGVAAAALAHAWHLEAYGIEIDTQRAKLAASILHRVLRMDYQFVRTPLHAFQVLFLNPPYDSAAENGKRLEYQFLRDTTKWLQAGGLLVYIVPQYRVDMRMASFLTAAYEQIAAYRFPDPEYAQFRQVVIFGIAKTEPRKDEAQALALVQACQGDLPVLPEQGLDYAIPNAESTTRFFFRGSEIDPADALAEAQARGVWHSAEWHDWLNPPQGQLATFQPLVPFKKGHLASVIAAGLMQNLRLTRDGRDLLVKGYTLKVQDEVPQPTEDDDDDGPTKTVIRDRFITEVVVLDLKTGAAKRISEPAEFAAFIEEWRDVLTTKVMSEFQPLYNFDLAAEGPAVNDLLNYLSKGRPVAGREETGLFPAQKHAAVALWKHLQRAGYALCVGEPGVGKTTIATTVAALFREVNGERRPTLVMCPPHLVPKWVREIQEIVPESRGFVVPLRRLSDVKQLVQITKTYQGVPIFAVLSREMAKLGSGWTPAYVVRKIHRRVQSASGEHSVVTEELLACPDCGHIIREAESDVETIPITSPAYLAQRKRKCFQCGAPLYQTSVRCGTQPRFPLAEYIAKKLPGFFGLFIADEAHQMKGQSTDQGYALGALVRACRKTLALTGTIYGGRATSLFYLLHRLSPAVRAEFKWTDGQKWAERFGILERVIVESEADSGYGRYSGKRRTRTYVREMPGVSPELVTRLLDSAVFLGLPDLGFPLPGYAEIPHELELSAEMRARYRALEELFQQLGWRGMKEDPSLFSQLIQAMLGWPNGCFRQETLLAKNGEVAYTIPALDADVLYPKEEWLLDLVQAQRARGRKTIVFCRQTATRDITPRLREILEEHGVRVEVLKASVSTEKREAWLKQHAAQIDVLIVNPKIVDTGLDLVDFQTIVWYEAEYSLYVLMQATKRIYRVGQVNDVEIHFPVYRNTLEHRAVSLAGQKWAAAQLLYGESVEGALAQVAQVDSGSFLAELTKSMIEHAQITDLSTLFRCPVPTPRVPSPDPTQRSPQLPRIPVQSPPMAIPLPVPTGPLVQLSLF